MDSQRCVARRELLEWDPPCVEQLALRDSFVAVLDADEGALRKAGGGVHLTASALVVSEDASRVLLVFHKKGQGWFQAGGHVEVGDVGLAAAALREAREETGLVGLELLGGVAGVERFVLSSRFGGCREHLDVRFVVVDRGGGGVVVSDESEDVRWFGVGELPVGVEPELVRLVEVGVERVREARINR